MSQVEIEAAAKDLPGLVARARSGEEVVLVESGREVAKLVPVGTSGRGYTVRLGRLEGQFKIPDDFDAPLPDEILDLFEGKT
jgi:antitoxin (DNA-binding transcriptional repressor) of toxin-antitoxin stability system